MIDRWSIDDLPMIEPCFAMNGHPRARMKLILRQCETPVKIYNSRWFPAVIYRSKWSILAGQGSNMKKSSEKSTLGPRAPGPRAPGPGSLKPKAPGPGSLRPRAPGPGSLRPWALGPGSLRPIGLEAPPGSQGETPLGSQGPPLGSQGPPPGTPGVKKSRFL